MTEAQGIALLLSIDTIGSMIATMIWLQCVTVGGLCALGFFFFWKGWR